MIAMRVLLILLFSVTCSLAEDVLKVSAGDSYLEAYQESKINSKTHKAEKKSDGGAYPVYSGAGGGFDSYGPSFQQYGPPSSQYGPQYGPPAPQYGPPSPQYGHPPSYGTFAEPVPQYGPPPPAYGPPAQNLQVFYGVPHAMISIWDKLWEKLKWKLDLFTFGKILLKLVIFKKIVSLIAIICLLLFIPSLKHKKGFFQQEDEGERGLQPKTAADEKLNNLASFVSEAIRSYTSPAKDDLNSTCATTYCRTMEMVAKIGKKNSYKKLAKLYAKENKTE